MTVAAAKDHIVIGNKNQKNPLTDILRLVLTTSKRFRIPVLPAKVWVDASAQYVSDFGEFLSSRHGCPLTEMFRLCSTESDLNRPQ
jgi:hypothetical protein